MRGLIVSAALAGFTHVSGASAHHSLSMFDLGQPIWVKGTVVRFEPVFPHVMLTLEQRTEDAQVRRWTVEGPNLIPANRNTRGEAQPWVRDDFLQPGDVIEVCGFTLKAEVAAQSPGGLLMSAEALAEALRDGSSRLSLHGHLLHMPDGRMQAWGYGKIANCIRPDDSVQQWVNFLETDRRAHQFWCAGRVSPWTNFPSLASKAFEDEVNRLLSTPCGE